VLRLQRELRDARAYYRQAADPLRADVSSDLLGFMIRNQISLFERPQIG
jgi:hypothetical protein